MSGAERRPPYVRQVACTVVGLFAAWAFGVLGLDGPSWGHLATAALIVVPGFGPLLWLSTPARWRRILWSDGPVPRPRHDLALTGAGRGLAYVPDDGPVAPVRAKAVSAVLQAVAARPRCRAARPGSTR